MQTGEYSPEDASLWLSDLQEEEFHRNDLRFDGLCCGGRAGARTVLPAEVGIERADRIVFGTGPASVDMAMTSVSVSMVATAPVLAAGIKLLLSPFRGGAGRYRRGAVRSMRTSRARIASRFSRWSPARRICCTPSRTSQTTKPPTTS